MNALAVFSPATNSIVERLGWVLLHSLWQFAVIAALSLLVIRSLRPASANARYGFLNFAMATLVLCLFVTWSLLVPDAIVGREFSKASETPRLEMSAEPASIPQINNGEKIEIPLVVRDTASALAPNLDSPLIRDQQQSNRPLLNELRSAMRPWLAWIVALWSLGVIVCAMRPTLSWIAIRRLRRVGTLPVNNGLLEVMYRVSKQFGVTRPVQLFQSTLVQVPVVLGYLRPIILLPACLLNNLPISQLEAILAHELAHVRRHDFLVNLLQTIFETLFFYHPAVWWLSHRIRVEREHCCDDLVIRVLGNRVEYGRALVAIEQLRSNSGILALGATDGSMLARIRRIVALSGSNPTASHLSPWNIVANSLAIAAISGLLSWQSLAQTSSKQPAESKPAQAQAEPFTAKFPNDVQVEFVGITEGAGDIKAAERWWKPDGTTLGFAPEYGGAGGGSEEEDKKNPYARTVICVHGIGDESAVTATAAIQTADSKVDESGGRYVAHYGYTDAPDAKRSFEVGVATEPLSLVRWLDRNGNRQGVRIKDARPGRSVGFALVGRMDIDGDSNDDSEKLKALIRMASGHVDAVLDAKLVTEGSLGTSTAFVVLGSDVDSIDNKEQSAKYAAFIREAKNFGATQISLRNLMGYLKDYKWPLDPVAEDITIEKIGPETWGRHVAGYGPMIDPIGPGDEPGGRKTGTTQVTIRIPLKWREVDFRLFAIDKAGKSHSVDMTVRLEPNEENADYTRLAKILPISFDEVDHFKYQFRLYRHWVTFENVSLRKGTQTTVNVKMETIPKMPESNDVVQVEQNEPDSVIGLGNQPNAPTILLPDFLNVRSVGFSSDSQRLVSVATKHEVTIRTWSIAEKKLISEVNLDRAVDDAAPLHGNQFLMSGLKLSQDLKRLVACVQGKVRIWNTEDGKLLQTLPNPVRDGVAIEPRGLTSTPNFDSIAAAIGNGFGRSNDCEIAIWQGEGYGRIKRLTHTNALQITSLALSANGSRLASGSQNATTCVFDLATSKLLYSLPNSNGDHKHSDTEVTETGANQILCLAFSPDGKKLAIGDLLGVKIVDVADGKLLHTIESEFRFGMSGLVFSSDGKLLARTASDKTVPIWSTETGKLVAELPTEAHDAAFSNDGKWFATGFSDDKQALSLWKFSTDLGILRTSFIEDPLGGDLIFIHFEGSKSEVAKVASAIAESYVQERRRFDQQRAASKLNPKLQFNLRFLGGDEKTPLDGIEIFATEGYGDKQKKFGPFKTNASGTANCELPQGFYTLHLHSNKEVPYLPWEKYWNEMTPPGPHYLNLNVTGTDVEKWVGGNRQERGVELAKTPNELTRITFTLLNPIKLVLRAVDADTDRGLQGAEFYLESAVAENWAHPIDGANIGAGSYPDGQNKFDGVEYKTDADGYFRRFVSDGYFRRRRDEEWGPKYGIWKAPPDYEAVEPSVEVDIDLPVGKRTIELVFKFRKVKENLTHVRPDESTAKPRVERLVINKDGEIWLERTKVSLDELRGKASTIEKKFFEIEADQDVDYKKVIEVVDVLTAAGVTELSFVHAQLGNSKYRVANQQASYKFDDKHGFSMCKPKGHPHYFTVLWAADGDRPKCILRTYPNVSDTELGKWAVAWEPETNVLWWVDDTDVGKMNLSDPVSVIINRENRLSGNFTREFGLPEEVKTEFRRLGFVIGLNDEPTDEKISVSPRSGTPGRVVGSEGNQTIVSAQCWQWIVEGTVTDADGNPLPNVTIRVSSNEKIKTAVTDKNGKYNVLFTLSLQQLAKWRGVKVEPVLEGYVERDMAKSGEFNALLYAGEQPQHVRIAGDIDFKAGPIPRFAEKEIIRLPQQGAQSGTADFVMLKADEK